MKKKSPFNSNTQQSPASEGRCPYYDCKRIECLAATSKCYLDRRIRFRFCLDDNYENCPVFLAKVLRGGRVAVRREGGRRRLTLTGPTVDAFRYSEV